MTPGGAVVCVGAHMQGLFMHVDHVPREGETVLGWGYSEPVDGGKVANVAVAAARLGARVALVTALGTDDRSHWWRDYFESEGVDTSGVIEFDGPMDVGPALLPPSKIPALVSVTDLGRRLTAPAVLSMARVIEQGAVVICALESPQDGAAAAFRTGRAVGATTILNASPAAKLDDDLRVVTDVVVVNEHEAASYAQGLAEPAAAVAEVRATLDVQSAVVTAGGRGAYVAVGDDVLHVPAPTLDVVVDTTGAGDAFLGALAARLCTGDSIFTGAAFAVRAASLACTRESTMPSFPTLVELAE